VTTLGLGARKIKEKTQWRPHQGRPRSSGRANRGRPPTKPRNAEKVSAGGQTKERSVFPTPRPLDGCTQAVLDAGSTPGELQCLRDHPHRGAGPAGAGGKGVPRGTGRDRSPDGRRCHGRETARGAAPGTFPTQNHQPFMRKNERPPGPRRCGRRRCSWLTATNWRVGWAEKVWWAPPPGRGNEKGRKAGERGPTSGRRLGERQHSAQCRVLHVRSVVEDLRRWVAPSTIRLAALLISSSGVVKSPKICASKNESSQIPS